LCRSVYAFPLAMTLVLPSTLSADVFKRDIARLFKEERVVYSK